jgi:CheY-like chemotaxis protein
MSEQKHVLLVEDQQMLQQLMQFELSDHGHELCTADNGVQALEQLQKHNFDVIVTDLFMPEMGGIELIETIRQQNIDLPVIVLSASRQSEIKEKLATLGIHNFIDKPITDDKITLLNHLIEAL